ncbi:phosphoesterase family-domain-containing protein [Xylogone sp. PMI_703]|nr:phosphoesterase family-domain-containing protein [Xylogone sp. PMI_703]
MLSSTAVFLAGLSAASALNIPVPNTSTDVAAIASELATATPKSPTSSVEGKVFNRFVTIMMENTNFASAAGDPNMKLLAAQGLTLTNYYGVTHPSEPNYCASFGGDYFGMDNDNFNQIPANVSNIWDILEYKGISFATYQENLPYTGFEGLKYINPGSGANNYLRKHNPTVLFNSNAEKQNRLNVMKDFEAFRHDLANNALPQHMFITPNMLNDAHDTSITYGADWLYTFVQPLLNDKHFMNKTLLLINFDESGSPHASPNRVMSIILSDILPDELVGATDDSVYTHYSCLSTVEANWDLDTLGRWDVAANVFKFVADVTGDVVRPPQIPLGEFFLNQSYPGPFAKSLLGPMPVPNTSLNINGRKVFHDVVDQWRHLQECTAYDADSVVPPDGVRYPKAVPSSCATQNPEPLPATTPAPQSCSSNNCLRQLKDSRYSSKASAFCSTYTTAVNTVASMIPDYLGNCNGSPSAVSSACSCLSATPTAA